MNNKKINGELDELADLYADMLSDPELYKLDEQKKKRTNELMSSIRTYLIDYPGELIYEKNHNSVKRKLAVIDLLWKAYDDEFHYDEIFGGDNTDFITNFAGDYIKRAKMIRPTFVSISNITNSEFQVYFREAIKTWLYGCDNAALIICNSLLEDILRNKLCLKNSKYATKLINPETLKSNIDYGFKELKEFAAKEGLLPSKMKKKVSEVQKYRNDAVHNLNTVSDEKAYELILNTKEVVEYLLNE